MGRYKSYVLLGLALVFAAVTALMIMNYLKKTKAGDETLAEKQTATVIVALRDIPQGKVISKEMTKELLFLKASLPNGYFSDSTPLVGRVVIYPVKSNEPIVESRLAPIDVRAGGVAALVSPKKRAVAVKVDKVVGVAGFIHAQSRVDVLVTIDPRKTGQNSEAITKTVLENILVLASGPEYEQRGKEDKVSPVEVITLDVTPEEAEKLALAATEGKIQLTLRNPVDSEDVLTRGATIPTLLASYSGDGVMTKSRAVGEKIGVRNRSIPVKVKTSTVELIKGSSLTLVKVEGRD